MNILETNKGIKQIKARRIELGISQTELAESSGISQSVISNLENGKTVVNFDDYFNILRALGIEVAFKYRDAG